MAACVEAAICLNPTLIKRKVLLDSSDFKRRDDVCAQRSHGDGGLIAKDGQRLSVGCRELGVRGSSHADQGAGCKRCPEASGVGANDNAGVCADCCSAKAEGVAAGIGAKEIGGAAGCSGLAGGKEEAVFAGSAADGGGGDGVVEIRCVVARAAMNGGSADDA